MQPLRVVHFRLLRLDQVTRRSCASGECRSTATSETAMSEILTLQRKSLFTTLGGGTLEAWHVACDQRPSATGMRRALPPPLRRNRSDDPNQHQHPCARRTTMKHWLLLVAFTAGVLALMGGPAGAITVSFFDQTDGPPTATVVGVPFTT